MSSPPARPRALATAERRRRILHAALELFDARGFEATTMDDIARAAGVARGTVFNHFRRKQSILVAWFAEAAEALARRLPDDGDPLAAIVDFFHDLAVLTEAHGDRVVPLMFELLDPDVDRSRTAFLALPLNDVLRRLLERARAEGRVRDDVSHQRLARVLANTFVLTALQWAAYRRDRSLRDELRRALELAFDGMRAAGGGAPPPAARSTPIG
ncbi:MAG: helix-turn-helix domain containing protein [Trueperaceae bacterium]|nr:helix-turn-helix domain containing protein [Trueperaceae bacterium]